MRQLSLEAHAGKENTTLTQPREQFERTLQHYQNEIKRLQLQVARESRVKSMLLEQLQEYRALEEQQYSNWEDQDEESRRGNGRGHELETSSPSNQESELFQFSPPKISCSFPMTPSHQMRPRTAAASASPSARTPQRAHSATPWTARTPQRPGNGCGRPENSLPKRPSTSSSPRVRLPFAKAPDVPNSGTPRSRSAHPGGRKFVINRKSSAGVGQIQGVPNKFSVREPLPYR